MLLLDVNILIYANRIDAERHEDYRRWLLSVVEGDEPYAVSDFVLNGYLRIVTDRRIYKNPTKLEEALLFAEAIRHQDHAVVINPGSRHWSIFNELCRMVDAKGKLVPDAYLAALAIEHGCEFVSTDRDFGRFPGLRWRRPLA
jgi:toxin-antitoxin system PIN domain toxin